MKCCNIKEEKVYATTVLALNLVMGHEIYLRIRLVGVVLITGEPGVGRPRWPGQPQPLSVGGVRVHLGGLDVRAHVHHREPGGPDTYAWMK